METIASLPAINVDYILNALRNANGPISDTQALEARTVQAICEADVLKIEAQITLLQETIADLTLKRNQKHQCARACASFLSPIRRLPSEVLEAIFAYCLPHPRKPDVNEAPLLLTHVCPSWRRVAMAYPHLWSEISLDVEIKNNVQVQTITNLIHQWFKNAGNCTLSLFLDIRCMEYIVKEVDTGGAEDTDKEEDTDEEEDIGEEISLDQILDLLLLFTNRFRILSITSDFKHHPLLMLPPGQLDALEHLVLKFSVCEHPTTGMTIDKMTTINSAPNLRRLSIQGNHKPHTALHIPWSQLTHIHMPNTRIGCSLWHRMLPQCGQLAFGVFNICSTGETPASSTQNITLPYLADLRIEYEDRDSEFFTIFNGLYLPALVKFSLRAWPMEYQNCESPYYSHFTAQLSKLQTLAFNFSLQASADGFLGLLKDMPSSITHLRLDFASDYQLICEHFTRGKEQLVDYLPRLERLEMEVWSSEYGGHFDPDCFIAMVQSRQTHNSSSLQSVGLKTVILYLWKEYDEQTLWRGIPDELVKSCRIGNVEFDIREMGTSLMWLDDDPRTWT